MNGLAKALPSLVHDLVPEKKSEVIACMLNTKQSFCVIASAGGEARGLPSGTYRILHNFVGQIA